MLPLRAASGKAAAPGSVGSPDPRSKGFQTDLRRSQRRSGRWQLRRYRFQKSASEPVPATVVIVPDGSILRTRLPPAR